ncbi:intermembrane phospholipid transport protein YdbH family protein [Stutzerimonas azotifigens]|uniref:intermembrane phospholipid transport protein YdbH family protein n=1 Tax=Stutzerimonas azotifigens TaxID=291995 RepID=UPI00041CB9EA|nr:YdbH domain-containing protein [Stutzerimonas azotifigens]
MRSSARLAIALALFVVLAAAIGAGAHRAWQSLKADLGIHDLQWSQLRLGWKSIRLGELEFLAATDAGNFTLEARQLELTLERLLPAPRLGRLGIETLQVRQQRSAAPGMAEDTSLPDIDVLVQDLARWLPLQVAIERFQLALPCPTGFCEEQGGIRLEHSGNLPASAQLFAHLDHAGRRLSLELDASGLLAGQTDLGLRGFIDGEPRLSLNNRIERRPDGRHWQGSLALARLPEAAWLQAWLGRWLSPGMALPVGPPEDMRLGGGWALRVPGSVQRWEDWRALEGDASLALHLPTPWPVPGLGLLQGELELNASQREEGWTLGALQAALDLQPDPASLAELPPALRPGRLALEARSESGNEADAPLRVPVKSTATNAAGLNATFEGTLLADRQWPPTVQLQQAHLRAELPPWTTPELTASSIRGDLRLQGGLASDRLELRLEKGSRVTLGPLQLPSAGISAERVQADVSGLGLSFTPPDQRWQVAGPVDLTAGRLLHAELRPLPWRWQGRVTADPARSSLQGRLTNEAGLAIDTEVEQPAGGALSGQFRLGELFLRGGNPFAATLQAWPELLQLDSGRVSAQASLSLPPQGASSGSLQLDARGLSGIYDTTELNGLQGSLALTWDARQLALEVPELHLEEANPGLSLGPLQVRGRYRAPLAEPAAGVLGWDLAELRLLGGHTWLERGSLDLARQEHSLHVQVRDLSVDALFAAYPAEGLNGSGTLDGAFTLGLGPQGPTVNQGRLGARPPGGVLQLRSPRIQALGRSNPAMRLVTEALDDFHYQVLTSDVRYAADGRLNLGLRLEGRNPALEGGRPINFNIDLEENIPALLTSLQLSDRVSETIQKRVQRRLQSADEPSPR